jgi:hypothetical protein
MRIYRILIATGLISCASACTANHGQYSMLSSRTITFSNVTVNKLAAGQPTYGESTCIQFFILPISTCSLNDAIEKALGTSDLLIDAQVAYEQVNLFPLLRRDKWRVTGKAVKTAP